MLRLKLIHVSERGKDDCKRIQKGKGSINGDQINPTLSHRINVNPKVFFIILTGMDE